MSKIIGNKEGFCRLCESKGRLCASHIVPEFLFKPLYTKQGPRYFFQISTDAKVSEQKLQKGFREYLLCQNCEGRFAVWERTARDLYLGGLATKPIEISRNIFQFEKLPYEPLKNFWNSLFWRLGVTKVPTWLGVELGVHEPELRSMLLRGDPGEPSQFGCILVCLRITGKYFPDMMVPPHMAAEDEKPAVLIVNGINHVFHIPKISDAHLMKDFVLQLDGRLIMGSIDVENIPALYDVFLRMSLAEQLRQGKKT